MRGIVFSAMGVAVITMLTMIAVLTLEHTKNSIPIDKTLLGGRIKASYYHINWEYKGEKHIPKETDIERGCAPFITVDLQNDSIRTLARPYVTYVCGD